jgi:hypothetical protein
MLLIFIVFFALCLVLLDNFSFCNAILILCISLSLDFNNFPQTHLLGLPLIVQYLVLDKVFYSHRQTLNQLCDPKLDLRVLALEKLS